MNKVWTVILLTSITALIFIQPSEVITASLKGAHDAVNLAIKLIATYGFWLRLFEIMDKVGVSEFLAKLLRPVIRVLFKGIDTKTEKYIAMNMSANILGLGNASTPMGINAMLSLQDNSDRANTNMIMLIVISATSLQLLPSTVISVRVNHHSISPTRFLIPCITATIVSTLLGIIFVKLISFIKSKILLKKEKSRFYHKAIKEKL